MFSLLPSSGVCEVLNDTRLEADEVVALRPSVTPKQTRDGWRGTLAAAVSVRAV